MASVQTENWWSLFLDMHGRDSEEEKAFYGFLQTKGIPATAGPDVLAQAYTEFQTFIEESHTRDASADKPPEEKASLPLVPRTSLSIPELEKPQTAATRPPDLRDQEAAKQPSPLSDPAVVQQATPVATPNVSPPPAPVADPNASGAGVGPQGGQALSAGMSQEAPPPKTPEEHARLQEEEEHARSRGRRGR